jgi:hypothetical protein
VRGDTRGDPYECSDTAGDTEDEDTGDDITQLRIFLAEARDSDAFDEDDVGAIQHAIASYEKGRSARQYVKNIIDTRVRMLKHWGDKLDFAGTHRDLGNFFLQRHGTFIHMLNEGGAASPIGQRASRDVAATVT